MVDIGNQFNSGLSIAAAKSDLSPRPESGRGADAQKGEFDKTLERASKAPVGSDRSNHQSKITTRDPIRREREANESERSEAKDGPRRVTRQTAMELFLGRMQSELGVSPDALVEAYGELTEAQLMGSPEETASAVIANLNLDEQKSQRALGWYNEMLAMTAAAGMSQYLVNKGQAAEIQVLSKKEARLQELHRSLDDMNSRFFMGGANDHLKTGLDQQIKIDQALAAQMKPMNNGEGLPGEGSTQAGFVGGAMEMKPSTSPLTNGAATADGFGASSTDPASLFDVSGNATEGLELDSNIAMGRGAEKVAVESVPKDPLALGEQMSAGAQNVSATNMAEPAMKTSVQGVGAEAAAVPQQTLGVEGATLAAYDGSTEDDANEAGTERFTGSEVGAQGTQQVGGVRETQNFGAGLAAASGATDADVQNNLRDVISKAQFLAQKGGGEMKIALSPEGIGDVNLKVKMANGNVAIEMVTDNSEAKKLLEKGLGELKESLAAHRLNLDSIKIDHAKDSSGQFDQRQQDLERGFQQRFLGDFQQRNGNFRREMFEFPAPSVPSSQTRDRAMNQPYGTSQRRSTDSSRRLDLVA